MKHKYRYVLIALALAAMSTSCTDSYTIQRIPGRLKISSSVNTTVDFETVRYLVGGKVVSNDVSAEVYFRSAQKADNLKFYVDDSLMLTPESLPFDGEFFLHDIPVSESDNHKLKITYNSNGSPKADSITTNFMRSISI